MRCASRYDDVGPLRYHQHPLFFQTMEPLQLAQIEDNSPVSRYSVFIIHHYVEQALTRLH